MSYPTHTPRILHTTNVYDGGISRAVEKIVSLTPQYEHHLLAAGGSVGSGAAEFASVTELSRDPLRAIGDLRTRARQLQPDLVHAHSSWAGFFCRAAALPVHTIYQPHCFVLQDPQRAGWKQGVFRAAEQLLSLRKHTMVVLTPEEESVARSMIGVRLGRAHVVRVPNAAHREPADPLRTATQPWHERARVAMIGRICPQKDPRFFAQLAKALQRKHEDAELIWIGDGDPDARRLLEHNGVTVTGWVGDDELDALLRSIDVYVHSALYEGFPLSVLDAASYRIPTVVRDIPCFDGTPLVCESTVTEVAEQIHHIVADDDYHDEVVDRTVRVLSTMNKTKQRQAFVDCYDACLAEGA